MWWGLVLTFSCLPDTHHFFLWVVIESDFCTVSGGFPSYIKASLKGSDVGVRFPASFTWQTGSLILHSLYVMALPQYAPMLSMLPWYMNWWLLYHKIGKRNNEEYTLATPCISFPILINRWFIILANDPLNCNHYLGQQLIIMCTYRRCIISGRVEKFMNDLVGSCSIWPFWPR